MLNKLGQRLDNIINLVVRIGAYIGGGVLALMMLFTVCDVFLRYAFNSPIFGGMDITENMMITLAVLAIAYGTLKKEHVKMDLVISRLPPRGQTLFDIAGYVLFLGLFITMTWRYSVEAIGIQRMGQKSAVLGTPAFPFYIIMVVAFGMICLILLADIVKLVTKMVKK